jgi:hypothetical protein
MPNTVNFYGSEGAWYSSKPPTWLGDLLRNSVDRNLKIGVINWWTVKEKEVDTIKITQFVDQQDVCFFHSEEHLSAHDHTGYELSELFGMLAERNVYFIVSCGDDRRHLNTSEKCFYFPWFFKSPLYIGKSFEPTIDYCTKTYDFNMLLGTKRSERNLLWRCLKENPRIYKTYHGHVKFRAHGDSHLDSALIQQELNSQDLAEQEFTTMINVRTEDGKRHCLSHVIPEKIYRNTHFDIVCESYTHSGQVFASEKTAKPLATGRFFCWLAGPHLIRYLKPYDFSFETYRASYDTVMNDVQRVDSLIDTVSSIAGNKKLIKHIYSTTAEERLHNMQTYRKNTKHFYNTYENWIRSVLENTNKGNFA